MGRGARSACAWFALVLLVSGAGAIGGCGGPARPTASDIYHDPALRRGELPSEASEQELLAQLDALPPGEPVTIAGAVYIVSAAYHAASGRTCRAVEAGATSRLACAGEAGWVFVPTVLGSDNPFSTTGEERAP